MRNALVLVGLLTGLSGCASRRGTPEIVVAPDPVIYPAPAEEQRYRPWAGIVDLPGLR